MADAHHAQSRSGAKASARPALVAPAGLTLLVLSIAGLMEAALMTAAARGLLSGSLVLALHLGLTAAAAALLRRPILTGDDGGVALLGVLATLATGPFGAMGALVLTSLVRRNAGTEARLAGWYERIALSASQDDFTQLSDRVAIGRAANLAAPPPSAFMDLFRSGPIAQQQSALGLIARAFHPGYLPVLKIALDSPEPVIRVQAAAVAARVRTLLQTRIASQIRRAANPSIAAAEAIAISSELDAAIASGLLEESGRIAAASVREALLARTFARADADARGAVTGALPASAQIAQGDSDAADAYAAHLLAQGRLADFRTARLKIRRWLSGRYRHRIVQARPARTGLRLAPLAIRGRR